ncbi:mechanosensitive ion channel [Gammaproteobacteria bacterium]|jgi:small conductance mechanosensitive channel|nr:mechanosensitive ion channel [Gammaproteobacteria bacterium]|tara:strand:+ start:4120 stop:4947 length:828 start_codon:yes stop_codon:yes gene_type:complete
MNKELPQEIINYAIEITSSFGLKLLTALIVVIVGKQLVKILLKVIKVALEKANTEETVRIFIANLLNTVFTVIIFVAAINQLGVETTSIIALLGAAGLAIGLALQGSLANFAAGILIVIFRPYKVGDYIEAGTNVGTVKDIQIFSTVLRTPDNKSIVVPNGSIMDGSITNYSEQPTRRIDIIASCSYEDDLDKVKEVLQTILDNEERILTEPKPQIAVSELAESSVNFIVRPWVNSSDYLPVMYSLLENIKKTFDKKGISIPYPQSDIHIHEKKA